MARTNPRYLKLYRTYFYVVLALLTVGLPSARFATLKEYASFILLVLLLGTVAELEYKQVGYELGQAARRKRMDQNKKAHEGGVVE